MGRSGVRTLYLYAPGYALPVLMVEVRTVRRPVATLQALDIHGDLAIEA